MTLLAETIITTVVSVLDTAMAATILRGRVDPLEDSQLPVVGVFQGVEEVDRINISVMDEFLEVRTEVADKGASLNIETSLNELRRQVHLALMVADALSLAYVIDIIPNGVDEPNIDGSSEKFTGTMTINWIVHYRHQYTDAGLAP